MVGKDTLLKEINEKYNKQQEEWEVDRAIMERWCSEVEAVSEKRRLDLLLAQNKLLQTEAENNAQIDDLRRTLAATQFQASITEERIRAILKRHKLNTLKMVNESIDKGWKTWSAQAAELQLLRADRDNRKAHGQGFFKMTEEAISTVQEDIAKDLYEIAACHREEVSRIMQEFDKHDVDTVVQLDNLESERRNQTTGLGAPETEKPRPSTEDTHKFIESEDEDEDEEDVQQPEPSLFDILQDDAEDELDEDLPLAQQE